ncbi:MAG: hypothetical protein MZV70_35785 [Desulfobacterales bacterium]|nr:hypothetical protein [Desulfobacterales bacterium]
MRDDFAALPRTREKRPSVGIVGEIFVRSHTFANENIIRPGRSPRRRSRSLLPSMSG